MILKIVCLDRIDIIIITNDKPNDTARVIIKSYYVLSYPTKNESTANITIMKKDIKNCWIMFPFYDSLLF